MTFFHFPFFLNWSADTVLRDLENTQIHRADCSISLQITSLHFYGKMCCVWKDICLILPRLLSFWCTF